MGKRVRAFGREFRLRTSGQLSRVRRDGRAAVGERSVVRAMAPPEGEHRRVGIVISRRFSPLAVARNRARRLFREVYRQLLPELEPAWILLLPRPRLHGASCQELGHEIRCLARQLGILKAAAPRPRPHDPAQCVT